MWCVIPAAGRGSRLQSASGDQPKPLVKLAGRPIVDWLLQRLGSAVTDVCLVVDDLHGPIRQTVGELRRGVRIHYALQPDPLGVGDAVLRARGQVRDSFLVVMGDVYYDQPLAPYIDSWRRSGAEGAVLIEPISGSPRDPIGLVDADGESLVCIRKGTFHGQARDRVCGMAILPEEAFEAARFLRATHARELELEQVIDWLIRERGAQFVTLRYRGWRQNINDASDLARVLDHLLGGG